MNRAKSPHGTYLTAASGKAIIQPVKSMTGKESETMDITKTGKGQMLYKKAKTLIPGGTQLLSVPARILAGLLFKGQGLQNLGPGRQRIY